MRGPSPGRAPTKRPNKSPEKVKPIVRGVKNRSKPELRESNNIRLPRNIEAQEAARQNNI
jgi:hypothetical protein